MVAFPFISRLTWVFHCSRLAFRQRGPRAPSPASQVRARVRDSGRRTPGRVCFWMGIFQGCFVGCFFAFGFLASWLFDFLASWFLASRFLGFSASCWFMRHLVAFWLWLFAFSAFPFGGCGFSHPLFSQFLSGLPGSPPSTHPLLFRLFAEYCTPI